MGKHKASCQSNTGFGEPCTCSKIEHCSGCSVCGHGLCLGLHPEEAHCKEEVRAEINDDDRIEIAGQIMKGFTSGRADSENGKKIAWSLETDVWVD